MSSKVSRKMATSTVWICKSSHIDCVFCILPKVGVERKSHIDHGVQSLQRHVFWFSFLVSHLFTHHLDIGVKIPIKIRHLEPRYKGSQVPSPTHVSKSNMEEKSQLLSLESH